MLYYIRQDRSAFLVESPLESLSEVINLPIKKLYQVLTLPEISTRKNRDIIIKKFDHEDEKTWPIKEFDGNFYINISNSVETCGVKEFPKDHDLVSEEEFLEIKKEIDIAKKQLLQEGEIKKTQKELEEKDKKY